MAALSNVLIWIIFLAAVLCILIRPWRIGEVWWAGGGAVLLVIAHLIPFQQAMRAIFKGADVYLFLAGMMILSELAREEGVFDWIASVAAEHAAGSPRRLFLLIYSAGVLVTAFLSNDATAVVLTPAVLTIVRRLKVEPTPHLLACAFIANAASFILPISNPANLVVFGKHLPPLAKWLDAFLVPSLASVIVTFLALFLVSGGQLNGKIGESMPRTRLSTSGCLALGGLIIAALGLITVSALGWPLGAPTCGAALLATLAVACRDKDVPVKVMKGVAWSVVPLVAGLFVIVEALQKTGMQQLIVSGLVAASHLGHLLGNLVAAFSVALIANCMNNLPVGLMSGAAVQSSQNPRAVANAVLIGVDLGPNLSIAGSLATILWLIALRREKVKITGWQFFKVGIVVMPLALFSSILFLGK